ncbi:MAG: dihydrolipoamide acetyltransferase family protein [Moraxellaceae bacterium]|nr:dihydrolipoamide acetyltransferase family protein [Moraxellaceae bacterium]
MNTFSLPDLGEGLADATLLRWHVQAGDAVQAGQPMLEVETAKAVVDIPAPCSGRIAALLVPAGATVGVGTPLLAFADSPHTASTDTDVPIADNGSVVGQLPGSSTTRDEHFLIGRHRHTEARLQQLQQRRHASSRGSSRGSSESPVDTTLPVGEALGPTRARMARQLATTRAVVPVTIFDEATLPPANAHQLTSRLVQALVAASAAEPALNAWFDGEHSQRTLHADVHVGLAVDTAQGLYEPVLRHAGTLSEEALQAQIIALKNAAAAQTLTPADMQGATLTLSNFGAIAGRFATPLVMPPQVAILGAGRVFDALAPGRPTQTVLKLPLSLTVDHRAVTGGEAARFLAAVIKYLQATPSA